MKVGQLYRSSNCFKSQIYEPEECDSKNSLLQDFCLLLQNQESTGSVPQSSVKLQTFLINVIIFKQLFDAINAMCFLKTLKTLHTPQPSDSEPSSPCSPFSFKKPTLLSSSHIQTDFYSHSESEEKPEMKVDSRLVLLNCLTLINLNSQFLYTIDQKLNQAAQLLNQTSEFIAQNATIQGQTSTKRSHLFKMNLRENEKHNLYQAKDSLTSQLFGQKNYRYRLALSGDFSNTLYKQRNFGFSIKLIDIETGKEKNNGNIINICLGICDAQGEWIHETKDGQTFLKGKIETELYHGSAEFIKLAPRDVSRSFPNKTVNMVVYPKPTILRYSGQSSIQQHIDFDLIQPLVVRDVSIRAKKRE